VKNTVKRNGVVNQDRSRSAVVSPPSISFRRSNGLFQRVMRRREDNQKAEQHEADSAGVGGRAVGSDMLMLRISDARRPPKTRYDIHPNPVKATV